MRVVVCAIHITKEPYRQVGINRPNVSVSLDDLMLSMTSQERQIYGFESHSRHVVAFFSPNDIAMSSILNRQGFVLLLFYATATVFQLYLSGDMVHEMRRRKPEPTPLLTKGIFYLPHHIGMA